jgi:hypothetical protein
MLNLRNHRQCPAGGFSFVHRESLSALAPRRAMKLAILAAQCVEAQRGVRRIEAP